MELGGWCLQTPFSPGRCLFQVYLFLKKTEAVFVCAHSFFRALQPHEQLYKRSNDIHLNLKKRL